jgi:hypothetical protein
VIEAISQISAERTTFWTCKASLNNPHSYTVSPFNVMNAYTIALIFLRGI